MSSAPAQHIYKIPPLLRYWEAESSLNAGIELPRPLSQERLDT